MWRGSKAPTHPPGDLGSHRLHCVPDTHGLASTRMDTTLIICSVMEVSSTMIRSQRRPASRAMSRGTVTMRSVVVDS